MRDVNLPAEIRIFVTDGKRQVYGPYIPGGEPFWTNTVFGSEAFIQVQIPSAYANRPENAFAINQVAHLEMNNEQLPRTNRRGARSARAGARAEIICDLVALCRPTTPTPTPSPERSTF